MKRQRSFLGKDSPGKEKGLQNKHGPHLAPTLAGQETGSIAAFRSPNRSGGGIAEKTAPSPGVNHPELKKLGTSWSDVSGATRRLQRPALVSPALTNQGNDFRWEQRFLGCFTGSLFV